MIRKPLGNAMVFTVVVSISDYYVLLLNNGDDLILRRKVLVIE